MQIVEDLCRSGGAGVILVDSVSALIPRTEMERDMGDPQVGTQARLMSNGLKRINQAANRHNTTVIFINQLRMKIGVMYGNPEERPLSPLYAALVAASAYKAMRNCGCEGAYERMCGGKVNERDVMQTTSGGMALKYYASQRIDVRKKQHIEGEKDGPAKGLKIKAKVVKNKVGPPAGVVLFDIIFEKGVDRMGCMLDAAVALRVVERRGAFHYFEHNGEEVKLGQGRDKSIAFLEEEGNAAVREAVEEATKAQLRPGQGPPVADDGSDDDGAPL